MLSVYTRHYPPCDHTDIYHRRCRCPKWIQGLLEGKGFVRVSAGTRSWEKAELKARDMERVVDPAATPNEPITIQKAVTEYLADEQARKVGPESLRKSKALLDRRFGPWCKGRKLHLLRQIGPAELREFRNSWNNSAATTLRKHERMRSFFAFCVSNNWLMKNPMEALKKPVVHRGKPTDYFTREEFNKIIDATYRYEYGGGNDCHFRKDRLKALVLLMRWSGLSIKDAVTLERIRLDTKGSLLLRRAKTGVPVYVPLPPDAHTALRTLPSDNPRYFFWNHVGDARFFNKANAQAAVATTLANCGVATISQAIVLCPSNPTGLPGPYTPRPATIADFAVNGLDSGNNLCGGGPCPNAAFPGQNPGFGTRAVLFPSGRSIYNGLQTSLRVNMPRPVNGIRNLSWQVSYALSRYISTAADSDFVNSALDNNHPTQFIGPNGLDRKHQFSFGGSLDLPLSLRFSAISHFYSPLPLTLRVPGAGLGGIFISDLTGDGSGDGSGVYPLGDVLTGTKVGAFGRSISPGDLNSVISSYNQTQAGQPTPAGQVLIQNGLFTLAQLQALGGVQQKLALAPPNEAGLAWLRALDLRLGWAKKITENLVVEPSVSFFNALNFPNFDAPGNTLSGVLDGTIGSVNGTTVANRNTGLTNNRVTPGSGTFAFGSPRVVEFGLRMSF